MAARKKSIDFEKSLSQLEQLVTQMESGDLSLEDALTAFEHGVKLTRECQQALQEAEQKVERLTQIEGTQQAVPFEQGDDQPT